MSAVCRDTRQLRNNVTRLFRGDNIKCEKLEETVDLLVRSSSQSNVYGRFLRLILNSLNANRVTLLKKQISKRLKCAISTCSMPKDVITDTKNAPEWLKREDTSLSLQHLCRGVITRQLLYRYQDNHITTTLDLPAHLLKYVLMAT